MVMSLTAALNTTLAGLSTIQVQTGVVSGNIANAQNPNYTRKAVQLTTPAVGGDPMAAVVAAIVRAAAPNLLQDYYDATADYGRLSAAADQARRLGEALGIDSTSGGQTPLESRLTAFEDVVKRLEATPEDTALKALVVQRGQELAGEINRLAGQRTTLQSRAQDDIRLGLETLNDAGKTIADLNAKIIGQKAAGMPTGDLEDLRDAEVAKIAGLVGVRIVTAENGAMSVYTDAGVQLVGVTAQSFSYDATIGAITNTSGDDATAGFSKGSLRASLDYLDGSASALTASDGNVGAMEKFFNQIDSMARNIADVVNAAYGSNLFNYTAGDAAATLAIDGSFTAAPNTLDATRMGAVQQAMRNTTLTAALINPAGEPNGLTTANVNVFGLVSGVMAYHARQVSDNDAARDTAENLQAGVEQKFRNLTGVNVDDELAQLTVLQNNYAALAQVMNAIREMFDEVISIGR
jgi:flagellar hook-associated protein 1 FlgK